VRRTVGRLTARQVANAKPGRGRSKDTISDGGNLHLQLSRGSGGATRKSWLFQYEQDGERHWLGLGPLYSVSLAEARDKARLLRQQLIDGIDPLEAKREIKRERLARKAEEARAVTFKQCAEMYLAAHGDAWKNPKHAAQWRSTLETYAFPIIGDLAVADVDTPHIVRTLEPVWRRVPETASRLRARIESVLGYATVSGFRVGDNPARWRNHLAEVLPAKGKIRKVEHHGALPYDKLPSFMCHLRGRDSVSARALEFTILTAARTGETIGARWTEIDLRAKTWAVPASRMKAGRKHTVPLADRAVELLESLPHEGSYVFSGARRGRPLSNMAMAELVKGMGDEWTNADGGRITIHGFRSTFRDYFAERTNYPNHVVEAALAHVVSDKVEAAYRRGDLFEKRRRLMADWDRYCARPAPSGATVTPLVARPAVR
jgi:integrase